MINDRIIGTLSPSKNFLLFRMDTSSSAAVQLHGYLLSFICTACQFVLVGLLAGGGSQLIMNMISITGCLDSTVQDNV